MSRDGSIKGLDSYLHSQLTCAEEVQLGRISDFSRRFVTISRQTGAGGITIGAKVAELLNRKGGVPCRCPWTVFEKDLVTKVLEEHNLPEKVAQYMPEDKVSLIKDTLDELVGLHPSMLTLVRETAETILHLAHLGSAIIVGRGGNIITRAVPGGYHVRLVGSIEKRVEHIMEYYGLKAPEAAERIQREDAGRKNYLKQNFGKNIDDPSLYDIVIDTDQRAYDESARMITEAVLQK